MDWETERPGEKMRSEEDDESLEATPRSFQSTYLEGKRRPSPPRRLMEKQNNRTNGPTRLWKHRGQLFSPRWGGQKSSYFTLGAIRAQLCSERRNVCSDLAGNGDEKHLLCQGKGRNESRRRRTIFYLQLREIRTGNFNQLFELVAQISWECDLKEDWQLLHWNTHKVSQCRGKIGDEGWTIQAASKAASNKGLKLERIVLGMETRAF